MSLECFTPLRALSDRPLPEQLDPIVSEARLPHECVPHAWVPDKVYVLFRPGEKTLLFDHAFGLSESCKRKGYTVVEIEAPEPGHRVNWAGLMRRQE